MQLLSTAQTFQGRDFPGVGDYGDIEKAGAYDDATKGLSEVFANATFAGVAYYELNTAALCRFSFPRQGLLRWQFVHSDPINSLARNQFLQCANRSQRSDQCN